MIIANIPIAHKYRQDTNLPCVLVTGVAGVLVFDVSRIPPSGPDFWE